MARLLEHVVLYRNPRFHAAFPSLAATGDRRLLLAFRRTRDCHWMVPSRWRGDFDPLEQVDHLDSRSQVTFLRLDADRLTPQGEPWAYPPDPEVADQDPSLCRLPDGRLLLASFSWYPIPPYVARMLEHRVWLHGGRDQTGCYFLFWGGHTGISADLGATWDSHHRPLPVAPGFGRPLHAENAHPIAASVRGQLVVQGDRVLLAAFGGYPQHAGLFESPDLGRSWQFAGVIARDPAERVRYLEPALGAAGDTLVCFMRTREAGGRLATARSPDRGATWGPVHTHELVGHPFHPLHLADGRVLLAYGYRRPPYGIRARLLARVDQDPDRVPEIVLRGDGVCPDLGYPWAVELSPGRVLVAYYLSDQDGVRHIAGSVLEL